MTRGGISDYIVGHPSRTAPAIMSLITEQNIETATSSPPLHAPDVANPPANLPTEAPSASADGLSQSVEQLARNAAEMQVQLHNLRTEIAFSSVTIARSTQRTAIAMILALVVAVLVIGSKLNWSPTAAPVAALAAANDNVERKIDEFGQTLNQVGMRLDALTGVIAEQKRSIELAAKIGEGSGKPTRVAGKLDCTKLPAGIQASEADFSIQFQAGSAKILPGSEATLDGIAKMLALVPTHCVVIEGHADASGNTEKNIALSKERANSVLDYIATKSSLNRSQLVAVGKGSSQPPVGTDALDPANRRVIFKVVPPGS